MSIRLRTAEDPRATPRRLAGVMCLLATAVAAACASAAPATGPSAPATNPVSSATALPVVFDVVLQPDGALHGTTVSSDGKAAPATVTLCGAGGPLAQTASNAQGQFAFYHVSPGLYELEVHSAGGLARQVCRVWSAPSAPPLAASQARILLAEAAVRGQIPFPMTDFRQTATVSALLAGAIAAPVVYYNAHEDNRVPSSP